VCSSATVDSRFDEQQVYIWAVVILLSIAQDIYRVIVNLSAIWCSGQSMWSIVSTLHHAQSMSTMVAHVLTCYA
jgi:hypothetical protein